MKYTNGLQINQSGKGIPYSGLGEIRLDGDANYGFKNLKTHPESIDSVPELERDPALRELVRTINAPESGLLSVGCTSGPVEDGQGHRMSGYVEFAFNAVELIADATNYFQVFFHFDRYLHEAKPRDIHFHWELMGATFREAGADGFTAAVTINTGYLDSQQSAGAAWQSALGFLGDFLKALPPCYGRPLYTLPANG